eukprot:TRINITY_DN10175_c0_g1_i1.p1 TRINITY_DN10175_c0_g1~~TRINITY_DN10175_c0_g1_i1.p1  ORF type:complete len:603 (+),score=123.05 TRINITY_DN10175_c0_g1_i1:47-1855(+)
MLQRVFSPHNRSFISHVHSRTVASIHTHSARSHQRSVDGADETPKKSAPPRSFSRILNDGRTLKDFAPRVAAKNDVELLPEIVPLSDIPLRRVGSGRKVKIETYGCQMNISDSEIIHTILQNSEFQYTESTDEADVIFLNTCAVRDHAEQKIWGRLRELRALRTKRPKEERKRQIVGVLGCMAERLKVQLLEEKNLVDIVAGPDSYRALPSLISAVDDGQAAIHVLLSPDETYADINPVKVMSNKVSAFVSIMRGCNNMCAFCIVPLTRGRERSRTLSTIRDEIKSLVDQGFKEVTLLGQNVNSYNDTTQESLDEQRKALSHPGFKTIYKRSDDGLRFADLLDELSAVAPEMRFRFTSPHPKDFPRALLQLIAERPNICKSIHIPAQSGSSKVLESMRRGYSRETYLELIADIKSILPGCALSSDFITGFCGETEEDHQQTLSLLEHVKYDRAFLYAYSVRERTYAQRHLADDVPSEVKKRRLMEMNSTFLRNAKLQSELEFGKVHLVLVEGVSRNSDYELLARTDTDRMVVFRKDHIPQSLQDLNSTTQQPQIGDYVAVQITGGTHATLIGRPIALTSLPEFLSVAATHGHQRKQPTFWQT